MVTIDWLDLANLADILKNPHAGAEVVSNIEWRRIEQAIVTMRHQHDWVGVIRLRVLFKDICTRDTFTGSALIRQLEDVAICAAEELGDREHLAIFWGDRGHNLHRQGFHQRAIEAFNLSSGYYEDLGDQTYVLRNRLMTAICNRALDKWELAYTVTVDVLNKLSNEDSWRSQPLQVMGWLYKDRGNWKKAEQFVREAMYWQKQSQNSDILIAGSLADLGELSGLQGKFSEAQDYFIQSLEILKDYGGQYHRQEARTKLKLAEVLSRQKEYGKALQLLSEADELCCVYGHYYDQLWKIELTVASILFRIGDYRSAVGKLASALYIRRKLSLSTWLLVRHILVRFYNLFALRVSNHLQLAE